MRGQHGGGMRSRAAGRADAHAELARVEVCDAFRDGTQRRGVRCRVAACESSCGVGIRDRKVGSCTGMGVDARWGMLVQLHQYTASEFALLLNVFE